MYRYDNAGTEFNESELEDMYDEWLDEVYDNVEIEGTSLRPSSILQECDSVAYREGFNNWLDSREKDGELFEEDPTEEEDDEDVDYYDADWQRDNALDS